LFRSHGIKWTIQLDSFTWRYRNILDISRYGNKRRVHRAILQLLSVFLRTVWDVNVATLRGPPIGLLFSLPMFFLVWLYCWASASYGSLARLECGAGTGFASVYPSTGGPFLTLLNPLLEQ